jgi:formamidopyrimidine-DNA glycosylase
MPEGVEVKIQTNILNRWCSGKTIIGINWNNKFQKNGVKNAELITLPLIVKKVWSRGKVIVFEMIDNSNNKLYLTSHLGMSGLWVSESESHTNFWITFGYAHDDGFHYVPTQRLYYKDTRHFGTMEFHHDLSDIWKRHGPCLMTTMLLQYDLAKKEDFNEHQIPVTYELYKEKIQNKRYRSKRIAEFMMEQDKVSGVGNYLRAEILYHAKISPKRLLTSLTEEEIKTLFKYSIYIMYNSYTQKGIYHQGEKCGDKFTLCVYKQEKDPNGYQVITFNDKNKRTCYYVPEIQK